MNDQKEKDAPQTSGAPEPAGIASPEGKEKKGKKKKDKKGKKGKKK